MAIELLLRDEGYPVCSPEFQRRERLYCEEDLKPSQLLQDNQLRHARRLGWAMWLAADAPPPAGDVLQLDSTIMAIEAAVAGNGVALAPHSLVQHDISANRLVRLFLRSLTIPGGYYLAHLEAVAEQPMVVAFREWLFAEASVNRELLEWRRNSADTHPSEDDELKRPMRRETSADAELVD